MAKFYAELITPEREFFAGEIVSLTIETMDGQRQILASHSPVVVCLQPGLVVIDNGQVKRRAVYSEGFLEIMEGATSMLCQTMEWPEEIELNRVKRAIQEHERKLKEAKNITEYNFSKASLARAFARLRLKG